MEVANKSLRSSSSHFFQFFFIFSFSILIFMSNIPTVDSAIRTSNSTSKTYIETACKSATYPKECYKTLSPYASAIKTDPVKLYKATLFITIRAARKTSFAKSSVRRLQSLSSIEITIIRDCAENVGNAVKVLDQSLAEMANAKHSADRQSQKGNIRAWVSTALTDEGKCSYEFDGQKVCNAVNKNIKMTVFNLAKLTSNCLALIDSLITL